jgi:trehalose-6-phosphate synthase
MGSATGHQIIVLANRQPYTHQKTASGQVQVVPAECGLVHAVEPLLSAGGGVWVAHGSGSADREFVDASDGLDVPPGRPQYRLRRVWLSEEEQRGYYSGFANEGLWPLCHRAFVKPLFRTADLDCYWAVNARFADAVYDEATTDAPIVLIQDYHYAFAPSMIREQLPQAAIVTFWHIPWPDWQTFSRCPWGAQILNGLLGSSVLGFQTSVDRDNFVDCLERGVAVRVDRRSMSLAFAGRAIELRVYPASIPWKSGQVTAPAAADCRRFVYDTLGLDQAKVRLGVSVDRMDFTKGIEEKLLAVERLLEDYAELTGRFSFVQVAEPSRASLPAYVDLRMRVQAAAERINRRFGSADYCPVILLESHHTQDEVSRYLRAADVCVVGSLHDGMNLVAKEFVRARSDERGILLLSQFTGAATQLDAAVTINPLDPTGTANAIALALAMPADEQRARMRRLREAVAASDAHVWAASMVADAARHLQTMMPLRTAYSTTSAVL